MSHDPRKHSVIETKLLTKRYQVGGSVVTALNTLDLEVFRGDFLAIMGASGSGKSTLLHLLGCLDSPTSGNYFLEGRDVSSLEDESLAEIRASKIGFVFQSFNLIPYLNVFENVEIPFMYQKKKENLKELITDTLEKVGLGHRLYHLPSELSGGEMQRVAIARALAIDPLLILADEPTGNLDSENSKAILNLFQDLHVKGVTIIMVTHDPNVASHGTRFIRMKDGQIIESS